MSVVKQTKPTKHMKSLCFRAYEKEQKLCAASRFTVYLKGKKSADKLFLACIKPCRAG